MYENLCGWGRVDICMTFHKRAFDFYYTYHCTLTLPRPPRYNDRLLVYPAVRIRSSRHYFCFEECAAVRCTIGCLLALIFLTTIFLPFMQLENKNNENYTL
jgi:hypothetical protein